MTLTDAQESTRRVLLAGTAIAQTIRTARADFMLDPSSTAIALSHAAAEIVAERLSKSALLTDAMALEDGFINSFRSAFRARIGAYGVRREW